MLEECWCVHLLGGNPDAFQVGPQTEWSPWEVFQIWPFLSQAFFDKDYITKHPGDAEKITQLKELMQEQVCLARAVWRHHRVAAAPTVCSRANSMALFITLIGPCPWSWAGSS